MTDEEVAAAKAEAERFAAQATANPAPISPACAAWTVTPEDLAAATAVDEWSAGHLIRRWQGYRCAVCGFIDALVLDHDHGLIRGDLRRLIGRSDQLVPKVPVVRW
ncbi:hypothetical protein B5D80_19710 [Micromonospora wenchangensis]|uniref:Uncharacterized protein n=1 Tax=Micromonospora wenchangensis TaxID=1185415 RepID=A0A246RJ43_9ACTN|nr:hypothetical protein [Micromonospora wenchangensis]OWV04720.1 hypothetical protein B5D80_19710 [Micromonospora wenchangensis]